MRRDRSARRYAQAAFEVAREHDELDVWERELGSLAEALATPEVLTFISSRQVPANAKEGFLRQVAGQPSERVWNLVRLLSSKGRLELIPQVNEAFRGMLDEERGLAQARVTTAVAMTDDEQRALVTRLSEISGKQVRLETEEDPEIIGGLVARIGDRLIDGSTKSKLIALKRRLAGATR